MSDSFTKWTDIVGGLEPVSARLMERWGRTGGDPADRQDLDRLLLSAVAGAWLSHVALDPAQPAFAPLWNNWLNMAGPNPDYVYRVADVDPKGVYRISGYRGSSRFVEVAQSGWEMMLPRPPAPKTPPSPDAPRPAPPKPLPFHDLDDLAVGADGYFSVILSAERPEGHEGDWWPLDPRCIKLMIRSCACDWLREVDVRLAIIRLDASAPMDRVELSRRMGNVARWSEGILAFDISHAQHYRDTHETNQLLVSQAMLQGGGVAEQLYYDCWYEIGEDEALIIDTAVPETARYWQLLVADDRFSTVDWVYRQSSLNDSQMRVDPDGRVRAVVSGRDPGVHNWLDKAGNRTGIVQMRLKSASPVPDPVTKLVPLAEVMDHLPAGTPRVSPEERAESLRQRAEGAQLRIYW
ncbi:DUF1214 domain-containing protein [Novosphingobium bradum]|uniref:DUF1214 domain-containing protein n=1 Tax=Novosphingobium bradum TaxID=1737444 RepID=A0ABV7IN80_9SPHN